MLYTEITWLSKARCLQRLFSLLLMSLNDHNFILDLGFLSDITQFKLNLQLQGKNKNIFELFCAVKLFTNNFEMLISNLKNKNLNTFKGTAEVFN